jgi:Tfp pilus assembly protein PilN
MRAVNLIPSEQRSGQPVGAGRSKGGAYAVLVLIAGFALMAYLYGQASHQVTSRKSQAASLSAQAQQTQAAAERLAPYTSFIALRETRMQTVDSLVDSRFDWAHVLHEFGRVMPLETSITALSGTIGSVTTPLSAAPAATSSSNSSSSTSTGAAAASATSATPSGSVPSFTISGCAINQPSVALMLERLNLIDGVKEVTLQSSTAGTGSGGDTSGGCSGKDVTFAVNVSFDPLPATTAVAAAAKTVSDSTSAGSPAAKSASSKVSAK